MKKTLETLLNELPEETRQRAQARADQMLAELPLHELRKARELSQQALGRMMDLPQSNISRIEHQTDVYVGTLRSYIEAMGGELDLVARFADGEYRIAQFGDIDASDKQRELA